MFINRKKDKVWYSHSVEYYSATKRNEPLIHTLRRQWHPTPALLPGKIPCTGGAWWAAVYGVAQSQTRLKWLSSSSSVDTYNNTDESWKYIEQNQPHPKEHVLHNDTHMKFNRHTKGTVGKRPVRPCSPHTFLTSRSVCAGRVSEGLAQPPHVWKLNGSMRKETLWQSQTFKEKNKGRFLNEAVGSHSWNGRYWKT